MARTSYRPLAGCKLFQRFHSDNPPNLVSVPLRGVSCFKSTAARETATTSSRPLAGCKLFRQ